MLRVLLCQADFFGQDPFDVFPFRIRGTAEDFGLVPILDRRRVGNAGPHAQDLCIIVAEHLHVPANFRPRAHKAHVAHEDIDQLRQFVDLRRPQDTAHRRDPRIGARRHEASPAGASRTIVRNL